MICFPKPNNDAYFISVTKRRNHAKDIIEEYDLQTTDG